jgi:hypothetical protein
MDINKILVGFERVGYSVRSSDEFICYVGFVCHYASCILENGIEWSV